MDSFDRNILDIIRIYESPVVLVHQVPGVWCTCVKLPSRDADPACRKCLGTGHQVQVQTIRAAYQDSTIGFRVLSNELATGAYWFSRDLYPLSQDDQIVAGDEAWVLSRVKIRRSAGGKTVFYCAESAPKRAHAAELVKMVSELMNK